MTTDQRLHAALTAVAEEVRVTEEEHAHAHHRFIHRRELLARRRRRTHGLVAAAAAAALVLGGGAVCRELGDATNAPQPAGTEQEEPLPEELPLSVDTLAGIWLTHDSTGWLWAFHRNGTLTFANPTARGLQAYEPVAYTVTDSGIELPDDLCDWELQVNSDATMVGQVVRVPDPPDSPCAGEDAGADQVRWCRLSPRSDHGASFVWTGSTGEDEETQALRLHAAPTDVESVGVLSRTWLQQGTGGCWRSRWVTARRLRATGSTTPASCSAARPTWGRRRWTPRGGCSWSAPRTRRDAPPGRPPSSATWCSAGQAGPSHPCRRRRSR
ncbi:hypothetical protein [Ornithinimicrobium sediminis]|uniref:hypothetical protein n=1 Tax=Ornithinimicrobium sediminis TaxID=2904603 RepID=UPI001E2F7146|nr:hypothetical protein [Ornithinimicrobium sediminis]MCE0487672.1 hypothetical protein [Ornithinimicrobium sediminis]